MRRYSDFTDLPVIERVKACAREYWQSYHIEPNVFSVRPDLGAPERIGPMRLLPDRSMQAHDIDIGLAIGIADLPPETGKAEKTGLMQG